MDESKLKAYRLRLKQLVESHNSWRGHWKEIAEYMAPRLGRGLSSTESNDQDNDGAKKHQKIINGSANDALRTIAAGLQGGLTSPSRPWFALTINDEDLAEQERVKSWLHDVRNILLGVFSRSNFYGSMHGLYKELAAFGTAAMLFEEDFKTIIHCNPYTCGEYYIGIDSKRRVDTLYRSFSMTAKQLVEEFGINNVSDHVKRCFETKQTEEKFDIIHAVQPRKVFNPTKKDQLNKPFESIYFESKTADDAFLRIGGYDTFPFVVPRWELVGGMNTTYGVSPGMDALGDVKMLQVMESKKIQALDKMINPPMNAPTSLRNVGGSIIPGGVNYHDTQDGRDALRPVYQINPDIQSIGVEIANVERRVKSYFFNDLFLSVLREDKAMTAREVSERHNEKMIVLGPVLERLQTEVLAPVINRTYDICLSLGLFPQHPEELEGVEVKIEYISLLAQAQKMMGTAAIEQTVGFVAGMAQINPEVVDKLDMDEMVDQYGTMTGVPPKTIRTDKDVAALRASRQQQQQQLVQQQQMAQAAKTSKDLSQTEMGTGSALDALVGGM